MGKPGKFSAILPALVCALTCTLGVSSTAQAAGAKYLKKLAGENPTVEHLQSSKRLVAEKAKAKTLAVEQWMMTNKEAVKKVETVAQKDGNHYFIRAMQRGLKKHKSWSEEMNSNALKTIPTDRDRILEGLDRFEADLKPIEKKKKELALSNHSVEEKSLGLSRLNGERTLAARSFVWHAGEAGFLLGDSYARAPDIGIYNILLEKDPNQVLADITDMFNINKSGSEECFKFISKRVMVVNLNSDADIKVIRHMAYHPNTLEIECSGSLSRSSASYSTRQNKLRVKYKKNTNLNPLKVVKQGKNSENVTESLMSSVIRSAVKALD